MYSDLDGLGERGGQGSSRIGRILVESLKNTVEVERERCVPLPEASPSPSSSPYCPVVFSFAFAQRVSGNGVVVDVTHLVHKQPAVQGLPPCFTLDCSMVAELLLWC